MRIRLFAGLAFAVISTCAPGKKPEVVTGIQITGHVDRPQSNFLTLNYNTGMDIFNDTISIDSTGSFSLQITQTIPCLYHLYTHSKDNAELYLEPGDSVHITFNAQDFHTTLQITGPTQAVQTYLRNKRNRRDRYMGKFYQLPREQFPPYADSIKISLLELQKEFLTKQTVTESLRRFDDADILYEWANFQLGILGKDSSVFNQINSQVNPGDSSLLNVPAYVYFLGETYLYYSLLHKDGEQALKSLSPKELLLRKLAIIPGLFSNPSIRQRIAFHMVRNFIRTNDIADMSEIIARFNALNPDPVYTIGIDTAMTVWKNLQKGMPAPMFSYETVSGEKIIMGDLKGNYIYIEVWASWCVPCRMELPHFNSLSERYKGEPVTFLSISVDESRQQWEQCLADEKIEVLSVISPGGRKADIRNKYQIEGTPRFILIGPDGRIVDISAPPPSGGIEKVIDSLLEAGT